MGLGWIFGKGLILGGFRWVLPWWCLVVAGSVWFWLQDRCWVLAVGMGGVRFAC